ncbi:MAG: hypothetical protein K0V04_30730 [Deltaproteobacteria bacterium]|nr:hypothetical protein [Deltaproteobacteria bacterium]
MELRPEVRRSQSELSLGRSLPIVHEQLWLRLPIVMLVVGALAVTASLWVPSPQTVRGSAVVRLPGLTHVRVDSKGTLGAVYVAEGEPLEAGQPLAMMSVPQIDADLRSARLALADAMATMLRAPRDNATGNLVREGRLRVRDLQRRKEALVIRAPSCIVYTETHSRRV